jgi:hypothetical protein
LTIENALPVAAPAAEASDQANAEALDTSTESAATEGSEGEGEPAKKEKTPEERELQRMRRALDKRTRQLYETPCPGSVANDGDARAERR